MQLGRRHQEEAAERRLVQGREHDTEHGEADRHADGPHAGLRPAQPLEHRREEFQEEDGEIENHAPGDFEHHGRPAERVDDGHRQVPGAAEVRRQAQHGEEVAEEAGQQGRPDDRVVLFQAEDVDGRRQRVAAGRKRHAAEQIEADPDPPGVGLREVGGGAQAEDEAIGEQRDPDGHDEARDEIPGRGEAPEVVREGHAQEELLDRPVASRRSGKGGCAGRARHGRPPLAGRRRARPRRSVAC
jgi:hypothetical protein